MNIKCLFCGAFSMLIGNAAYAVISGPGTDIGGQPTACMNCKLSEIYGDDSGTCTKRCKDCCEPECIDYSKECGMGVIGCVGGTYGISPNCMQCPSDSITHANTTSDMGMNLDITGCYIPSGASFYDDTGVGVYSDKCYYAN